MPPEHKIDINELKKIINSITPNSCPKDINFHSHTIYSDGSLTPAQLISQAVKYNIKHIAVTDHHSINAYPDLHYLLDQHRNSQTIVPKLWTGIEISCILKKCLVHVLGLGFDLSSISLNPYTTGEAPIGNNLNAENVVKAIHAAGGLVILAHPARYRVDFVELINEAHKLDFDGIETWYDYEYNENWHISEFICESIHNKCQKLNLLSTCGTDTHGNSILAR